MYRFYSGKEPLCRDSVMSIVIRTYTMDAITKYIVFYWLREDCSCLLIPCFQLACTIFNESLDIDKKT